MSLFEELKRRHVFKVALAYCVVAWLLIQVASVISKPMSLPAWFEPVVLALLILGLPVALVLAWAFDLSPVPAAGEESVATVTGGTTSLSPALPRRVMLVIVLGTIAAGGVWLAGADERRARSEGLALLDDHVSASDWEQSYQLATRLQAVIPQDETLAELWPKFTWRGKLVSEPAGARIYRRAYRGARNEWQLLGTTPLEDVRIPFGLSVVRADLEGYEAVLQVIGGSLFLTQTLTPERYGSKRFLLAPEIMRLDPIGSLPEGMVRVPGWSQQIDTETWEMKDYFLARYEVSNLEYKEFVDAGGYEKRDFWEYPVSEQGNEIPWERAMRRFRDQTDRPGPSTWVAGDFPDGRADHPVSGISWYEAAAYARFRGQTLPSVHHWRRAFAEGAIAAMVPESNLGTDATVPVGTTGSISWAGNFDMAGNAREWVLNEVGGQRFILGGAWNNDPYRANDLEFKLPPLNRSPGNGVRLAVIRDEPDVLAAAEREVELTPARDIFAATQVSDEVFEAYRINYSYDRSALNATIEALDSDRLRQHELVEIDAAYPALRLPIHLYLPANAAPPYQVVVFWPGSIVQRLDRYEDLKSQFDFILKSGRAVALPIYYSSFGRRLADREAGKAGTAASRDEAIRSIKDLFRTVDYLENRPDIDSGRIAFFGNSWGARFGAIGVTLDPRFRTAVFYTLPLLTMSAPDIEPATFLTRMTTPSLILSGEYDPVVALNEVMKPAFELIGAEDKRMVTAPGGHFVPYDLLVAETLAWYDKTLGNPVQR
jgi:dienelactone hydrolase